MKNTILDYLIRSQFEEIDKLIKFNKYDEIIEFYKNYADRFISLSFFVNNP